LGVDGGTGGFVTVANRLGAGGAFRAVNRWCGRFATVKWRNVLCVGFALGLVGCSGESSKIDELNSVPSYYLDNFDDCRDEALAFRNNPTGFLMDYDGVRPCGSTEDLLVLKASVLPSNMDPNRSEFVDLVWLIIRSSTSFNDNSAKLAEEWQDCFSQLNQRLTCLDVVISASDSNSSAYDRMLLDVEILEQFIPQFETWVRD